MREIFDLTQRFVEFPPSEQFVELQVELSRAIERQAEQLAGDRALTPVASALR
jgi:hypothetical protein